MENIHWLLDVAKNCEVGFGEISICSLCMLDTIVVNILFTFMVMDRKIEKGFFCFSELVLELET